MTIKDLGLVTAYAYAVSQGYTGTEEEFAELMASYATVAEEAAESAAEAAASAEAAGTSETNAASSAASAGQSATSAGNSATSASGSAVQAQALATEAGQSATAANTHAVHAGESATAAAGSASQAAASETAAGASATAAAGSATSASGSATAAAGSADAADASADRAQEILDSIPEDYSELSEDVSDIKSALTSGLLEETIDYGTLIQDEYVASSTGAITSSTYYSRTDFINVENYGSIKVTPSTLGNAINALCFYSSASDSSFISGKVSPATLGEIAVPDNAKYAICSGQKTPMNSVVLRGERRTLLDDIPKKADKVQFNGVEFVTNGVPLENVIGVQTRPGNLIALDSCENNVYVLYSNGTLVANSGYFATSFIPVEAGKTYKSNVGRNWAWYKADKTYLSGTSSDAIQKAGVTAPENAAFIRFTVNKTTDAISTPAELYFAELSVYDNSVTIPGLHANAIPWCYGQKINWIGDSIVDGDDFDEKVTAALGLIETDYGINGSTIALNGDGTDSRNALCARYADMTNDADIIAVSCGTNDFEYAWSPIGDIDSTENTTFYGALKTLCEGLIAKYPQKLIFFTTPIKRAQAFENGNGGEYTADGVMTTPFSKNKYGKTLMDYADIIKEVCGYYSIPVLDLNRESLLNPHLTAQQSMFDNVYTHPNATGQAIMARRVAGWLMQLGYEV